MRALARVWEDEGEGWRGREGEWERWLWLWLLWERMGRRLGVALGLRLGRRDEEAERRVESVSLDEEVRFEIRNFWKTAPLEDHFSFSCLSWRHCGSCSVPLPPTPGNGKPVESGLLLPLGVLVPEAPLGGVVASFEELLLFSRGPRSLKVWREGGPGQSFPFFRQLRQVGQDSSHWGNVRIKYDDDKKMRF